jgi:hypothetical protein
VDVLAEELEVLVPEHRPGKKPQLEEDLESVAYPQDHTAPIGEFADLLHQGGESGDGPGPEVIPIGEASGKDDAVDAPEVMIFVPEEDCLLMKDIPEGIVSVMIAV